MILLNPPLADVVPLFRALHNFHVCISPQVYHSDGADSDYEDHLRQQVDKGARIYAVEAGWGLVAYLLAVPEDIPSDALRRGGRRMKIDHLYIAPTHRGAGLGHHLVAAMEADMRDLGLSRWIVAQDAVNAPATAFYEAVGGRPRMLFLEKSL